MSKRNPNDPIPGFEDEFTGTVGKEKRIHKTHFDGASGVEVINNLDTGNEWIQIKPGRWVLKTKEK